MPMSKGRTVTANGIEYRVSDIRGVVTDLGGDYAKLPYSLRILTENVSCVVRLILKPHSK
jgi:aconitase A